MTRQEFDTLRPGSVVRYQDENCWIVHVVTSGPYTSFSYDDGYEDYWYTKVLSASDSRWTIGEQNSVTTLLLFYLELIQ